jgi:hypothetical protein
MRKLTLALLAVLVLPAAASAQAGTYPALQPTQIAEREYNFALADFDGGTALLVQWREGLSNSRLQFTGDLGLADFADEAGIIIGGGFAFQMLRASGELPFDMALTGGLGLTLVDNFNLLRIPVGVAIGHRFPLEGGFAISPFVHPRLSIDRVSVDTPLGNTSDTDTNIDIDIGGNLEFNPQMQVRLAATLGDRDAVGISFAWTPRGLRR